MNQQNESRKYRPILPRTESCYSLKGIQDQIQAITPNISTMCNNQRGSHESSHVVQLEGEALGNYSSRRETPKRGSSSPRSIIVCPETRNTEGLAVRFHWEETSEYPSSKESEKICGICNQRWELHSRWDRSRENERPKKKYKVIITGSRIDSIREITGDGRTERSRLLYDKQEEDRRVLRVHATEEAETREYLDTHLEYSDDWITKLFGEDLQMVEQEPISRKTVRNEGVIHPWADPDGEDEFDALLGEILPYIPDPDI